MPRIVCDRRVVPLGAGQRLLDGLLAAGFAVPHSCRAGACQSCLVRATSGEPPAASQVGLKDTLRAQGYFLACLAEPKDDLEVSLSATAELAIPAHIVAASALGVDVMRVMVQPAGPLPHRAGQFLTVIRRDGLSRAYSIASLPGSGGHDAGAPIELHVRVLPGGRMSTWLASPDALGAELRLRGPAGDCFYTDGKATQPLLLAGTGTGLAPLWAIARDALRANHTGPIELWHGSRNPDGFYLVDELRALSRRYPQFEYRRCSLDGPAVDGVRIGRLDKLLLEQGRFAGKRVFLCGDPELVLGLKKAVFLAGAALKDIHADAFVTAPA